MQVTMLTTKMDKYLKRKNTDPWRDTDQSPSRPNTDEEPIKSGDQKKEKTVSSRQYSDTYLS